MRRVGEALIIEDVPVPEIGPDEALVATRTCGICGTDLHILAGHGYVPPLPHILGHEPAGVVERVGREVTHLREGDHVVPHLFFHCGRCRYCRSGSEQQCADLKGILGVLAPGAFAEFFKIPGRNLFRLHDQVPFDVGGLIADAVVTALHAVKRSGLERGDTAVVVGAGGVGQAVIQILHAQGVSVAATDRSPEKLKIAMEMGAVPLDPAGPRADCVFNCAGSAESMRASANYVMRCGRIVVIGEEPEPIPLDTIEIAQQELEIIGSRNGTRADMQEAIHLVESGIVLPSIAARFRLEEINAAFDFVRAGALGRVVITVS